MQTKEPPQAFFLWWLLISYECVVLVRQTSSMRSTFAM